MSDDLALALERVSTWLSALPGPGYRGPGLRSTPIAEIEMLVAALAIAAGTQRAETSETSAPSEGCQSGPKGIAPNTHPNHPRST